MERQSITTPPFLLGIVLLFWGWQTNLLLFAAPMALLLEGARFIPFKWDFTFSELQRVSDICSVILIGMLLYLGISRNFRNVAFTLFQWLPLAFLPLMLAQNYGTSPTVDARALFLTMRRKSSKLHKTPLLINLSYPYVLFCLLAAGSANVRTGWFYVGLAGLVGWGLGALRSPRYSWAVWAVIMVVAGLTGYVAHVRLHHFQLELEQNATLLRWFARFYESVDPYHSTTAIGDIGEIKLSNEVMFRVRSDEKNRALLLLREASYNVYDEAHWYAAQSEFIEIAPETDDTTWKIGSASALEKEGKERVSISSYLTRDMGILRLPNGTFQIEHLPVGTMAANQYGAIKVEEGPGLITYRTLFASDTTADSPPNERDDDLPKEEELVLRQVAEELHLTSVSPDEALQTLAAFFRDHFSYSLDLQRQSQDSTPLADFLLHSRSGHCEYFASATVLLLRAAGIPARYAVGYSADTLREGHWRIVRGSDAHAWALIYKEGRWQDFDTTPPSWRTLDAQQDSFFGWISDLWTQWKFAFSEWRWQERKGGAPTYLGWLVVPLVLILIWRVYRRAQLKHVPPVQEDQTEDAAVAGSDSPFYLIAQRLQDSGFDRESWEPLSQWIRRIEQTSPEIARHSLATLLMLHYRYRFDPEGLTSLERATLRSSVQAWLQCYEEERSLTS